jgi:three-Cys-motif partner protein
VVTKSLVAGEVALVNDQNVAWPAEPHTLAKIELVRSYLEAWLRIIGRTFKRKPILYIDGFAGPGIYSGGEKGSPIAALRAASRSVAIARDKWQAGDVFVELIEKDRQSVSTLRDQVVQVRLHERVHVSINEGTFEQRLADIQSAHPLAFRDGFPLFAFVDPFGVKGVPFQSVRTILSSTTSELFVNFDVDGIHRVLSDPTPQNYLLLDALFGDQDWRTEGLLSTSTHHEVHKRIWSAYRLRLKRIGVRYTYPFVVRGQYNQVLYYLVFASRHRLGIIKMKEAMAKVGQHGTLSVSDALNDRQALFDLDDPNFYLPGLLAHFGSRKSVDIDEVYDYILTETQYGSLSKILTPLAKEGRIVKRPENPKRRANAFNDVRCLDFVDSKEDARWRERRTSNGPT